MPDGPDVVVKPVFGNLGAFVNGSVFAGLLVRRWVCGWGAAHRVVLDSSEGTGPFGPSEGPMRDYVAPPLAWVGDRDATSWRVLIEHAHVAALPAKAAKDREPIRGRDVR